MPIPNAKARRQVLDTTSFHQDTQPDNHQNKQPRTDSYIAICTHIMQTHNKPLGTVEGRGPDRSRKTLQGSQYRKIRQGREKLQAATLRMHEAKPGRVSKTQY
ncbi:hypothetical protein N7467_006174 [Penicillium canescens]|nr:hypothetical protein N7467_006174 [Penicillium canescens]